MRLVRTKVEHFNITVEVPLTPDSSQVNRPVQFLRVAGYIEDLKCLKNALEKVPEVQTTLYNSSIELRTNVLTFIKWEDNVLSIYSEVPTIEN